MKNKLFTLAFSIAFTALFTCFAFNANSVEVTFRVDMSQQVVSNDGVHIAGSFQGWNPASSLMTDMGNGIYALTFTLNQGEHHNYKFINGMDWAFVETVPAACGEPDGYGGYNRFFDVPANDTVLLAVCFGSCIECNSPNVNITFQVDMSNETVSPNGVHIAGSFQGWNPGATEMLHIGGNVYSFTTPLAIGDYIEYKYINGTQWGEDESVPAQCAAGLNRYLTIPGQDSTLQLVCFGSCDPCSPTTDVDVTFRVDMSNETISPLGVHIAGSFQGWNPGLSEMSDIGNNVYEITFTLQSGVYHEYKFINGNDWGMDETVPWPCNANNNRYINIPETDTTLMAVCFGSCNICNPAQIDVTFRVDMSYETVAAEGVHVAGSFQGWDPAATAMSDIGNSLYEVTLTLNENDYHEYKFINGIDWPGAENVPQQCSAGSNRYFSVPDAAITLPDVCFSSCDPCPAPSYDVDITVYLEGPFNGSGMNTSLNSAGYIPFQQPFNTSPWNYNGSEQASPIPNSNVVDWVLVELRETTGSAITATSDSVIARQAAFLLNDGSVVGADGSSLLNFTGSIDDNLFAVIWSRNHLGVMSQNALLENGGVYTYDFTTGADQVYGGFIAHKQLAPGQWGMAGGDGNADRQVNNSDKVDVWTPTAGNSGYEAGDFNMDGQVNNQDKVDVWEPNGGMGAQVPDSF
ncbi:MAG: hypothetical protein JXA03_14230 [Bacteroidales bacterium]|nr:hypothetical protein [Bacteroidales bacterium]